ncbi:MAG: hypothetical protein IKV81_04480, partial [Clostridia bacterium]|nr:hypothetical protein [Clostridia bacterium]
KMAEDKRGMVVNNGTLFGSGMVAGEGVVGILLAIFTVLGVSDKIKIFGDINGGLFMILGAVLLVVTIGAYFMACVKGAKPQQKVDIDE